MDEWDWVYARDWVDFIAQRRGIYLADIRENIISSAPSSNLETRSIHEAKRLAGAYEQEYVVWRTKRRLLGGK
jgi:hypothetical protein